MYLLSFIEMNFFFHLRVWWKKGPMGFYLLGQILDNQLENSTNYFSLFNRKGKGILVFFHLGQTLVLIPVISVVYVNYDHI